MDTPPEVAPVRGDSSQSKQDRETLAARVDTRQKNQAHFLDDAWKSTKQHRQKTGNPCQHESSSNGVNIHAFRDVLAASQTRCSNGRDDMPSEVSSPVDTSMILEQD
mmetsp:Transcript_8701/g.17653  ORF Transcript_8701/g.17653 Transcript_8701/m.17653 type:complete len:107 (+) Transcript_8701:961-1281(+)